MKFKELTEASYHGKVIVEAWDDDGQTLYRMSRKDVERLQYMVNAEVEHQDTRNSPDGFTDQERAFFKETNEIFERAEVITPELVFDHHNFEFVD